MGAIRAQLSWPSCLCSRHWRAQSAKRIGGEASIPHPAPGHDLRDPLRIAGIEVTPAFEDFEHVFIIGQPDQRGALGAEFCDVEGRVEGLLLR